MSSEKNKTNGINKDKYELPLEAYKILISLVQNDENLFWRRSEIFLVINGGLITILGLVFPLESNLNQTQLISVSYRSTVICVIGIILCLAWIAVLIRGELFYNHWVEQLKYLENQYLTPIRVFNIADDFFANGRIQLGNTEFRLTFFQRHIRMFRIIITVPLLFIAAWVLLIFKIIQG